MDHITQIRTILKESQVVADVTINEEQSIEESEIYTIGDLVELAYFPESKTWEVGYWADIPGSYWEPGDVDYVKVHETRNIVEAVKYAITSLVDLRLNDIGYAIFPEPELEY